MSENKICALKLLEKYKSSLSKQQYKTFRGQIKAGDIEGFRRGLSRKFNRVIIVR